MANYTLDYEIQVTDINGDTAVLRIPTHVADTNTLAALATILGTLATDVAALTNGKITRQTLNVLVNKAQYIVGTSPPSNAQYDSVTDGARLQFANSNDSRSAVTIPAPILGAFGANSLIVDSTVGAVSTFIADYQANARDTGGNALNLYKGGIKVGRRARRRRSSLIP